MVPGLATGMNRWADMKVVVPVGLGGRGSTAVPHQNVAYAKIGGVKVEDEDEDEVDGEMLMGGNEVDGEMLMDGDEVVRGMLTVVEGMRGKESIVDKGPDGGEGVRKGRC
jgi:hypothetical protein